MAFSISISTSITTISIISIPSSLGNIRKEDGRCRREYDTLLNCEIITILIIFRYDFLTRLTICAICAIGTVDTVNDSCGGAAVTGRLKLKPCRDLYFELRRIYLNVECNRRIAWLIEIGIVWLN